MMEEKDLTEKFYLGMDIGTNSVGMACTDGEYKLKRAKGKDAWCVRLFDEAETAETRRTARTARRRLKRRRFRIGLLQELFAPLIDDETFFMRLNNSQFFPEDKDPELCGDKNTLFADAGYTDKNFHKEFPTIFHLRKALLDGEKKYDMRLYYLAMHHIVKYRGHFLYEGESAGDIHDLGKLIGDLNAALTEVYGDGVISFDESRANEAKDILIGDSQRSDKQNDLTEFFNENTDNKKLIKNITCGICGLKISPKDLFGESYGEEKSLAFSELDKEKFEGMRGTYGDDFVLLEKMRAVYSFATFEKIFKGASCISAAMISLYDRHKTDLKRLKAFVKKYFPDDKYREVFKATGIKKADGKTEKIDNYVAYIGYTKKGGEKKKVAKCKDDEFRTYVKKLLEEAVKLNLEAAVDADYINIKQSLDAGEFMPKILHADNGLFPHQVNGDELGKILASMQKFYPEVTDEFVEKTKKLFAFRVPYYVGPLVGEGDNHWAVRKADGRILPWNFDEMIDKAASNEEFMRRMTKKCTYLRGEDVLPKASVLYQKYDVLNQLNKLRINDAPISERLKKRIFDELFMKYPRVTDKKIIEFLQKNGEVANGEKPTLSGKDGDFKASMSSYINLKKILGDFVDEDYANGGEACESIILWHALNTDKSVVEWLIKKNYGHIRVIRENLNKLKGLTFRDFGRLSKKLLAGIEFADKATGEIGNLLYFLYERNLNLNEFMFSDRYTLKDKLEEANCGAAAGIDEYIDESYVSPAVKRGIRQALRMADEYVAAFGQSPDKVFIEVTREDGQKGDKGRTRPRKKQLQEAYKKIEGIEEIAAELNRDDMTDLRLRQERLYLYFRQLGRCMYSGAKIDLEDLLKDGASKRYDVDHILPRTYIKDDSIDNKALVCRELNARKSDTYPLPEDFMSQKSRWKLLCDKGLIAKKTYDRLTRTEPLGDNDYNGFINRQKVITDQTAKAVAELMKIKFPDSDIVYSKAKNVSDFRQKFDLFKCRETNDLHHARDAYLNIVVGNVYDVRFSRNFYYKDGDVWRRYNLKNLFTREIRGAWDEKTSLETVKKTYGKNTMAVTRYATCGSGGFYNQTVYGKDDESITQPRKTTGPLSDMSKYGGYKSEKTAYFAIVQSTNKNGKYIKTIEAIPVLTSYREKKNPGAVTEYLTKTRGLVDPEILVEKVKVKQLFRYNGTLLYIAGITGKQITAHNATELFTDNKTDEYVRELVKLSAMKKDKRIDEQQDRYVMKTNGDGVEKLVIDRKSNLKLYKWLVKKLCDDCYKGVSAFNVIKNYLVNGEETFIGLSVADQVYVLLEVLKFLRCTDDAADIRLLNGSQQSGKIVFNQNITDIDFELVYRSPAGLTERVKKI